MPTQYFRDYAPDLVLTPQEFAYNKNILQFFTFRLPPHHLVPQGNKRDIINGHAQLTPQAAKNNYTLISKPTCYVLSRRYAFYLEYQGLHVISTHTRRCVSLPCSLMSNSTSAIQVMLTQRVGLTFLFCWCYWTSTWSATSRIGRVS
jgi:hypothetical protein